MKYEEAEQLSLLFTQVVTALPYYNGTAKRSELGKYSSDLLRDSISSDPDSVLVARDEREIVGFCLSREDDELIWLAWFGVHQSYRRRGIGSALLQKLEETVRNGRSHKIWCDCRTDNEASKLVLTVLVQIAETKRTSVLPCSTSCREYTFPHVRYSHPFFHFYR
jgi:ribosomal protein S18 acetylase RimI-like enzyme